MSGPVKLIILSLIAFGLALGAEQFLVPHVLPIAWSDEPQPVWQIVAAFLLRALENIFVLVGMMALMISLGSRINGARRTITPKASSPPTRS